MPVCRFLHHYLTAIVLAIFFACAPSPELLSPPQVTGDYVVVLHGIARSNRNLKPMAKALVKHGYQVINIDYPSTDKPLEELIELVHDKLVAFHLNEDRPVHFVAFSLGSLIVRGLIHKYRPPKLGRVVLLAPPNHGSHVASFFKKNVFFRWIFGPAGQQLITDQSKIQHLFGPVDFDLGIIAGNRTLDPICALIIPGEDDGKVSVESTKLEGMKDHIVVSATHTLFPHMFIVQQQAIYFLEFGEFQRPLPPKPN